MADGGRRARTRSEAKRLAEVAQASSTRMQLRTTAGRKRVVRAKPETVVITDSEDEDEGDDEGGREGGRAGEGDGEGKGEDEGADEGAVEGGSEGEGEGEGQQTYDYHWVVPTTEFREDLAPTDGRSYVVTGVEPEFFAPPDLPPTAVYPAPVLDAGVVFFVREQLELATDADRWEDRDVVYRAENLPEVPPLPPVQLLPVARLHELLEGVRGELNLVCLGQAPSWRHRAFYTGKFAEDRHLRVLNEPAGWLHPRNWLELQRWVLGAGWPIPFHDRAYSRMVAEYALEVLVPEAGIRVMAALVPQRPRDEVLAQADMALRRRYRSFPKR